MQQIPHSHAAADAYLSHKRHVDERFRWYERNRHLFKLVVRDTTSVTIYYKDGSIQSFNEHSDVIGALVGHLLYTPFCRADELEPFLRAQRGEQAAQIAEKKVGKVDSKLDSKKGD